MFFINHNKLTDKVTDKIYSIVKDSLLEECQKIAKESKKEIINKIAKDTLEMFKEKNGWSNDYMSYEFNSTRDRVTDRLVQDIYELNRAEILNEVSKDGIMSLLDTKLKESAKNHVLDFIAGTITNNNQDNY